MSDVLFKKKIKILLWNFHHRGYLLQNNGNIYPRESIMFKDRKNILLDTFCLSAWNLFFLTTILQHNILLFRYQSRKNCAVSWKLYLSFVRLFSSKHQKIFFRFSTTFSAVMEYLVFYVTEIFRGCCFLENKNVSSL